MRILHVEDASHWSGWVARILDEVPRAKLVGLAETGASAIELARKLSPALVLLDIVLPDMDGFAIAEELRRLPKPPTIVLLSARMDQATIYRATQPPFSGLLWKDAGLGQTLVRAIDAVDAGQDYYPPEAKPPNRACATTQRSFSRFFPAPTSRCCQGLDLGFPTRRLRRT